MYIYLNIWFSYKHLRISQTLVVFIYINNILKITIIHLDLVLQCSVNLKYLLLSTLQSGHITTIELVPTQVRENITTATHICIISIIVFLPVLHI